MIEPFNYYANHGGMPSGPGRGSNGELYFNQFYTIMAKLGSIEYDLNKFLKNDKYDQCEGLHNQLFCLMKQQTPNREFLSPHNEKNTDTDLRFSVWHGNKRVLEVILKLAMAPAEWSEYGEEEPGYNIYDALRLVNHELGLYENGDDYMKRIVVDSFNIPVPSYPNHMFTEDTA